MTEQALRLFDTSRRTRVPFVPRDPNAVGLYQCGPTVYDRAHVGNARAAVVYDVLYRVLRHLYGVEHVRFVRNFTDIDDKINARAAAEGRPIRDLTEETIGWYLEDMSALGCLTPTDMPRATDFVPQMIAFIEALIAKGHAYAAEGHVLFAVDTYADYGALSGRSTDDMIAGARVEVAPYKRNPMDFVLWKPSDPATPGWDSPWGRGRPGWHIECSAMSRELLGDSFDLHTGGLDLQFPHHENEIAQSKALLGDDSFAQHWLHNEMLQVEGKKMSKSLGNFFTVKDLLDQGYPGEVIRFVLLSTHYRSPMDWTDEKARQAEATLRKWREASTDADAPPDPAVVAALRDDLNTPGAIAALHAIDDPAVRRSSAALLGLLAPEMGAWTEAGAPAEALIEHLIAARAAARAARDFGRADAIRDAFAAAGVEVKDGADGTSWSLKPGFDAAKLEVLR